MHLFYLKNYLITGYHGQEEHKETPGSLGGSFIGLYLVVRAAHEIELRFSFRFSVCFR